MSRFTRITALSFTALAIAVAPAALTRSEDIPRIVFHSPMDIYYKQAHRFGNEVWPDPDTNYFYDQVRDMGATHTVGYHSRRVFGDSTQHWTALQNAHLKTWVVPDRVGVAAGDSLDVAAMYMLNLEDEFWAEQGELWPTHDWFRFSTNVGSFDQDHTYVVCVPGTDSEGYMFEGGSLNSNVFFYPRAYSVALELYLETQDSSDTVVCLLHVHDPNLRERREDTTLTIRTSDVPLNKRNQWVYIAKDWNVGFKAKDVTKFSLYWPGEVLVRFSKMHIYDKNYRLLFKDDSATANWAILRNHLISNYTDLSDVMEGWMVDEPHRPTWDNFSRMRDSIATWMQDSLPNADLQVTAISSGLGKDLIGAYLAATGVPQLIYDFYPISWNHWSSSVDSIRAGDTLFRSIQRAWDDLIYYIPNPDNAWTRHGGLRAAVEESQAADPPRDWWFCMQTQGECRILEIRSQNISYNTHYHPHQMKGDLSFIAQRTV